MKLFLLSITLAISLHAQTANLWVDTSGGTCARSSSPAAYNDAAACSSFTAAYNAATGGDTIYVRAGTYGAQTIPSRSIGTSVTTIAKDPSGGAVTLTGGLKINASYVIVDGFISVDFDIGTNNGCSATPGNGWPCSFPTTNVILRNFDVEYGFINGDTITVEDGDVGPMGGCEVAAAEDGIVILGQGSGPNSSWTPAVNVTIDNVTIHDITNSGCGEHVDGIQGYGYRNLTVRNSRIYNVDSSLILAYSFDNANPLQVDRILIENNMFGTVPNPGHGITLGNDTTAACGTNNLNNVIQNNTFYGNMMADVNCAGGPDAIFRNNIVRGGGEPCGFGAHDFSWNFNVFPTSGAGSGCTATTNAIACNPTFADPSFTGGVAALSTSDTCAKDRYSTAVGTYPALDYFGTSRPQGSSLDVGAHELSAGASSPTVTTSAATSITSSTATGNGNVTSDGGSAITQRGVCWSTSSNPVTGGTCNTSAGTTGSFSASMTSLSSNTLYHYRAYAINAVGTSYGTDTTFTTLSAGGLTAPTRLSGTVRTTGSIK